MFISRHKKKTPSKEGDAFEASGLFEACISSSIKFCKQWSPTRYQVTCGPVPEPVQTEKKKYMR